MTRFVIPEGVNRRHACALAFGLVLGLVAACKKSEGGACKAGESFCANKTTALSCKESKLVTVACRGALGCNRYQDHANCDDSIAAEGETCMGRADDEYACSADKKLALVCKGGTFVRHLACRGTAGCALLGQRVSCDQSVASKDETCKTQGASACSEDAKEMLICRDGKFAHHRHCRGPAGCYSKDDAPACDETFSREQDECGVPGYVVCSVDRKHELLCEGGRFVRGRVCRTPCTLIAGGRGGIDCK